MDETNRGGSRWRSRVIALALASGAFLIACSDTAGLTDSTVEEGTEPTVEVAVSSSLDVPASSSQVPESTDLSFIFEIPTDPIEVAVVLDASKTVEVVVPVEGGTITATGADGTVYTLDIPSDALLTETTVGLTPIASISGMPFGNDSYAVQMSPEGLFFYDSAILTITPAEPIPVDEQIVFGYQGDGSDLIVATPVVDSADIKIQVQHFSGNGVTKGLLADIDPVRERLGGDVEQRLKNALNAELSRTRQRALAGLENDTAETTAAFEAIWSRYVEFVLKPRVAAAGESCAAGRLAIETVLGLAHMRGILGLEEGDGLRDYPGLVDSAARVCILEEFELCVEEHVIHRMARVWRGFERQYALMDLLGVAVDPAVLREARELTVQCLTFKLTFDSSGTVKSAEGGGYASTVTAEVTLRFNPDENAIRGDAPLVNTAFEWFVPVCNATGVLGGGGPFQVLGLKILTEGSDAPDQPVNFAMSYLPGDTSESATLSCPDGPPVQLPTRPWWTELFVVTHEAELDAQGQVGGGYVSIDWEVFGDELFATKEWTKQVDEFAESGAFQLFHTPGG